MNYKKFRGQPILKKGKFVFLASKKAKPGNSVCANSLENRALCGYYTIENKKQLPKVICEA